MANLTRYEMFATQYDGYKEWDIGPEENGSWVKFEDIKDFLPSASHNISIRQLLCELSEYLGSEHCGEANDNVFKLRIKSALAQLPEC